MVRLHNSVVMLVALFVLFVCHGTALELGKSHSHLRSESFSGSGPSRTDVDEKCGPDFHHYIEHFKRDALDNRKKKVTGIDCYALHRCENKRPPTVITAEDGKPDIQCESIVRTRSREISCPHPSAFSHLVQKTIDREAWPKLEPVEHDAEGAIDIQAAVCELPTGCPPMYDQDTTSTCKYLITCPGLDAELVVETDGGGVQKLFCVTPVAPDANRCQELHPDAMKIQGETAIDNKFFREECFRDLNSECAKYAYNTLRIKDNSRKHWVGTFLCKKTFGTKKPKKPKYSKQKPKPKKRVSPAMDQTLLCGPHGPFENEADPFFTNAAAFTADFAKPETKVNILTDEHSIIPEQVELKGNAIDIADSKKFACVYGCYALFARAVEADQQGTFSLANYVKRPSNDVKLLELQSVSKGDSKGLAMCKRLYDSGAAVSKDSIMREKLMSESSIDIVTAKMQQSYKDLSLQAFSKDVFSISCRDWCQGLLITSYNTPTANNKFRPRTVDQCAYVCALKESPKAFQLEEAL